MPVITLQIMVNAPTHDLSHDPPMASMRYRNGDILTVYRTKDFATLTGETWNWNDVISSPRSVFVHITGVPLNLAIKAGTRLTDSIAAAGDTFRRRKFRIPPSVVPIAFRNKLLADKEATITYTQVKAHIRKKSIVDVLDASQDNEDTALVDGDLL